MNKFISIASLFIIYAILIVSSNGKTTTMLQENLKKRATSTSEQSMYIQKMISKKRFGASSAGAIATDDKQCDEEKSRLQDEIDALRAEVKDLKEKADKPSRPRICCKAMTKKCLACSKGVSVEEFCKTNSGKFGCPPTKPSICPMPMCAAVMPRPGCKHVMTKEKNERGCPKYPCGKVECEPEIIGRPEKCPESVDRCKVGEKRVKDPNVYWNDLVQFRPRRGLLSKENALPPSAMLDRCGYVYICVPDTKKCPAKEPRHCPVARCRPPSKGCKYVQDDERKENCCRKHICGIEKCGEMPEEIDGPAGPQKCPESVDRCKVGEKKIKDPNVYWNNEVQFRPFVQMDRPRRGLLNKENALPPSAMLDKCGYVYICVPDRKGNNEGGFEYDATKLETYLNDLCRGGTGIENIKRLITQKKDNRGRVLLIADCKDKKCDCERAKPTPGNSVTTAIDKMSICMEKERYMLNPDKQHSLGNPFRTGESYQYNGISLHTKGMNDPHIIVIDKPDCWWFIKVAGQCTTRDYCSRDRRRRLLNRANCGS